MERANFKRIGNLFSFFNKLVINENICNSDIEKKTLQATFQIIKCKTENLVSVDATKEGMHMIL